ncbi:MAG: GNAT family N-acetyltransferase [Proteobacteria bacterium]|nr:GNAT family N-acetyltransferase [Pseudomonadota bacterium]MBU1739750.1 GNAT family N-acetyltransferase [Pseudomonadota bacterium]
MDHPDTPGLSDIQEISGKEAMDRESSDKQLKRTNIKIREMEIDDLAEVFHLGEQLFKVEQVPNMYRTWDPYEVVGLFHSDTEFCLVAELGETIIGFALGTTIEKSRSAWKYGYLVWLGVDPDFQRQGVAEKLFRRFKDIMLNSDVRMMLVDTQSENLPALRFFRKLGFGHPEEHIYLTMNVAAEMQARKKKGLTPSPIYSYPDKKNDN